MDQPIQSVLFITTSFPRYRDDFAGSFIFRFAKYLVRNGIDVTVLAPGAAGYADADQIEGINVRRFTYFWPSSYQCLAYDGGGILANLRNSWLACIQVPFFFGSAWWAIRQHRKGKQIIHCHWTPMALLALWARCGRTDFPPIVLTNWGSDTRLLPMWFNRWIVSRMDGCISTAVETDEHLLALGRPDFWRISAPVDEDRFCRELIAPDLRQELGIAPDVPVLTFIGRLNYFKDPITFIRACAILKQKGIVFIALVAGDGDLMAACQTEISRLEIQDVVYILGFRTDPERILRIAAAFVHISPIENTWANAIAEAMFMQVPVILSDVGYTRRLFSTKKDCLIVAPSDAEALAEAFMQILDDNLMARKLVLGANNLLKEQEKDSQSIAAKTKSYYLRIFNEQRQKGRGNHD